MSKKHVRKKVESKKNEKNRIISFLFTLAALLAFSYLSLWQEDQPRPVGELSVHFIDVGQGDATLILGQRGSVLIDAGEAAYGETVINYLREQGVLSLDYVVATHPHSDHIGGLAAVINAFDVENVLAPQVTANTRAFERFLDAVAAKGLTISSPERGDSFNAAGVKFTVLAPLQADQEDINNASIVLRMENTDATFLFMGDAEALSEREILSSGLDITADVIKIGHHGSRTSSTQAFLDDAFPAYGSITAVISCGTDNSYGHPHTETMSRLEKLNAAVYRTDLAGTIVFTATGELAHTGK